MQLKVCSFNIEWMSKLFEKGKKKFKEGIHQNERSRRKLNNVPEICERISGVIKEINPDILGIMEGPRLKEQMDLFVERYLDNEYKVYFMPGGSQCIHILVRREIPSLEITQITKEHEIYKNFCKQIRYYTWHGLEKKKIKITRLPVVLSIKKRKDVIELTALHLKSKISNLRKTKEWEKKDKEKIIKAIEARQRLSAELILVRNYVTRALLSKRALGCLLMGDFNDGPNKDIFEECFLINNLIDELRGSFHRESVSLHHVLTQEYLNSKKAFTSDFNDPTQEGRKIRELIDHIFVSDYFYRKDSVFKVNNKLSKIEHEIYEKYTDNNGKTRNDRPSDHRPITTVIEY